MTLYRNLSRKIKYDILRGDYPPGSRLPSLRTLAKQEQCNQATVKRAMQVLWQEQLVFSRQTARIFVTDDLILIQRLRHKEQTDLIRRLYERLVSLGFTGEEILIMIQEYGYGRSL